MPLGYWEAKDANDDLDGEVVKKFKKGYPQDNIIFSDDAVAVLWQNRAEVLRCDMTDPHALERLLKLFFSFERPEIAGFRAAVEQFKTDLPAVLLALRQMIDAAHEANPSFRQAEEKFLTHAQEAINPSLTDADVREMLIQHILTEEIFAKVFDDADFHQHNNVARELYALEGAFFTGALKKQTLKGLETYYAAIRAAAAQISSHGEKQTFLKIIYENFYKVYNTKAADRLGVVYTPNEIVRFMIDGADWLYEKHFGKNLVDRDVDILDPATRAKNRGEQAAAEVLSRTLEVPDTGAVLVFEDSAVRKTNFLLRLPDAVVVASTSEFLFGMEQRGLISSAQAILDRAVDVRGNEVLARYLAATDQTDHVQDWSQALPKI